MRVRTVLGMTAAVAVVVLPASARALAPVGPDVVGLWQAEGDATDPFHGHDGTLLGGASLVAAGSGQAFSFTGAEQAVDVPDAVDLQPTGSFTVAAWERTTSAAEGQVLVARYECGLYCPTDQADATFMLEVSLGKAEVFLRDADGPYPNNGLVLQGTTTINDGADHHLALVRDSGAAELRLVVDGVVQASAALTPGSSGPLSNLDGEADDLYLGAMRRCGPPVLGCDGALVDQFAGTLDDAVFWSRAVSTSELAAIHTAGPNGLTTDVTAPESAATAASSAVPGALPVAFTASDPQGPAPRVHDPSTLARVDLYAKAPGETAFAKVATVPGAASGTVSYVTHTPGAYAFATVAVDVAGNAEALPAAADATTLVSAPPAVVPASVEQVVVGLPSARRCVSRRSFSIHLRLPTGTAVRSAVVSVNGRRVAARTGRKLTAPVNLKGLPKGRYTVKIVLRLASGRSLSATRHYRTCAGGRG